MLEDNFGQPSGVGIAIGDVNRNSVMATDEMSLIVLSGFELCLLKEYGLGDQVVPRELMERGLSDERNHSQDRAHEACKCKAGSGAPYGWERAPVCRAAWQPEVGMLSFIERITSERRSY